MRVSALEGRACGGKDEVMPDPEPATATLVGRYALVPSPCTTEPCLPGMVYAIESAGQFYLLAALGRWSERPFEWNGWTPALGDLVRVSGQIKTSRSIRGEPFLVIEVESMTPCGRG